MMKSIILKNSTNLHKDLTVALRLLTKVNKLQFWKRHFKEREIFRTQDPSADWQALPFLVKEDYLNIGLEKRIQDSKKIFKQNPFRFILQCTSGTSQITKPVLMIKNVDCLLDGIDHGEGDKMLILYQSRAITLRDTIALCKDTNSKGKPIQSLVVNPFRYSDKFSRALADFKSDSAITFPACISFLLSTFPKVEKVLSSIKKLWLSGDFMSSGQEEFIRKNMKQSQINLDYIHSETDTIGMCCKYLQKKYGSNVYHPFSARLIELIDIDENGIGEIVTTRMDTLELAFIRYRTGDLARVENILCRCGLEWTIFLEGRKQMDYIKQLGVLITRAEIERVLGLYSKDISDWRGEVREGKNKMMLVGELTLILKLNKGSNLTSKLNKFKDDIASNLYLTPQKKLKELVLENKFMPLKIKIVDEFPQATKRVPLRKILT